MPADPELTYTSPTTGRTYDLESNGIWWQAAPALRGWQYAYTLQYRGLSGVTRKARSLTVTMDATNMAMLDKLNQAWQADVATGTPGTLRSRSSDGSHWVARAYVVECDPNEVSPMVEVTAALTVVLTDGVWLKDDSVSFAPTSTEDDSAWLDYPLDYPLDYSRVSYTEYGQLNAGVQPAPVRITFYGPCSNPSVRIGGNTYQVNCQCGGGERIVIDGLDKTITRIDQTGGKTSLFDLGVRGTGQGCGTYCFEKLPPDRNDVSWDSSFRFDVTVLQESGCAPWTL